MYHIYTHCFYYISIYDYREGSLVVNYTIEVDDTEEAAADTTVASVDLGTGQEQIEVLNQNVTASSLTIENITGKENDIKENTFEHLR